MVSQHTRTLVLFAHKKAPFLAYWCQWNCREKAREALKHIATIAERIDGMKRILAEIANALLEILSELKQMPRIWLACEVEQSGAFLGLV